MHTPKHNIKPAEPTIVQWRQATWTFYPNRMHREAAVALCSILGPTSSLSTIDQYKAIFDAMKIGRLVPLYQAVSAPVAVRHNGDQDYAIAGVRRLSGVGARGRVRKHAAQLKEMR